MQDYNQQVARFWQKQCQHVTLLDAGTSYRQLFDQQRLIQIRDFQEKASATKIQKLLNLGQFSEEELSRLQRVEAACLGENGSKTAQSELQKDSVSAPKQVLLEMHAIISQKL